MLLFNKVTKVLSIFLSVREAYSLRHLVAPRTMDAGILCLSCGGRRLCFDSDDGVVRMGAYAPMNETLEFSARYFSST